MPSPDPVGAVRAGVRVWISRGRWTMLNLSRRDFVVSTGLAIALGLDGRLAISPAFAQKTADPAKGFVTYKVGGADVIALYDGIWEKPHDPAFVANASVDDVKGAMTKAGLPADFVSIPFTAGVVGNGGKNGLWRSGTGRGAQTGWERERPAGRGAANAGNETAHQKPVGNGPRHDRHHAHLSLSSRSHFRADGKGHQQAGIPERGDRHLRRGIQVLDRSGGHRPAA